MSDASLGNIILFPTSNVTPSTTPPLGLPTTSDFKLSNAAISTASTPDVPKL